MLSLLLSLSLFISLFQPSFAEITRKSLQGGVNHGNNEVLKTERARLALSPPPRPLVRENSSRSRDLSSGLACAPLVALYAPCTPSNPLPPRAPKLLPARINRLIHAGNGAYIIRNEFSLAFARSREDLSRIFLSAPRSPRGAPPLVSLFSRPITPTAKESLRHRAWRSCVLARQTRRPD